MSEAADFQKYHQPWPCKFCGRPASYVPLNMSTSGGVSVDIYFCHNCRAEYMLSFRKNGEIVSTSLYTEINGETYRWTVSFGFYQFQHIKHPGTPGLVKNEGISQIKGLFFNGNKGDIIPDITPENINEKLRTYLLFS